MADRSRRGGRTTPKGTKPAQSRNGQAKQDPMTALVQEGGDDLLRLADPFAAEVWASHTIGTFDQMRAETTPADAVSFEQQALERCRELRTPQAAVAARALTAVLAPPLDQLGQEVVTALGTVELPAWTDRIGHGTVVSGWVRADASLLVCRLGGTDHGIVISTAGERADIALVDHPETWQQDATETPLGDVVATVAALLDWPGAMTEGFVDNRALVRARLRTTRR